MSRPLIITDCDEVLLYMIGPFRAWLAEAHDVHFDVRGQDFTNALRRKDGDTPVERELVWTLLTEFFETQMHRQHPISGAVEAIASLSRIADIEVLTNIGENAHRGRIDRLRAVGIDHPVHWNQGPKGPPASALVAERQPRVAFFIDDLGFHHQSVAEHAPEIWRLHMIGEPEVAADVPAAQAAHARIDDWAAAEAWIRERIEGGAGAPDRPEAA